MKIEFYGEILKNSAEFSPLKGELEGVWGNSKKDNNYTPPNLPFKGRNLKNFGGLENSWRNSRQTLSQKCAKDFGAKRILTAHHATDLVETMIFRLTKGCSVNGLSPFDTSTKPFWEIPKSEILNYAKKNNVKWVEDSTNENLDFERNLIRKKVLPELRKITPNLEKVFVRESILFAETQEYLNHSLNLNPNSTNTLDLESGNKSVGSSIHGDLLNKSMSLQKFLNLPQILQKEFLQKISGTTCSFSEIQDCLKWLKNNPKGNSQKKLGKNILKFKDKKISWS